jgi:carbon storage regulator
LLLRKKSGITRLGNDRTIKTCYFLTHLSRFGGNSVVFLTRRISLECWLHFFSEVFKLMLIISRKKDQKIIISDDIEITILEVGRNRVRFGIKAPKHVTIHTRLKQSPEMPDEAAVKPVETPEEAPKPYQIYPAAVGGLKRP